MVGYVASWFELLLSGEIFCSSNLTMRLLSNVERIRCQSKFIEGLKGWEWVSIASCSCHNTWIRAPSAWRVHSKPPPADPPLESRAHDCRRARITVYLLCHVHATSGASLQCDPVWNTIPSSFIFLLVRLCVCAFVARIRFAPSGVYISYIVFNWS